MSETDAASHDSAPNPESRDARREGLRQGLLRAEQAVAARRFGEAAGICEDLLDLQPDFPPALAILGAVAGQKGDLGRGIALLENAMARQPGVAAWHSNLSGLLRMQYRTDDAVAQAQEAARLQPGEPRFQVNLGKALLDNGDRDEAVSAFMRALALDQSNPEAHLAIGQILLARGEMLPGWREYEWRNQLEQARGMVPKLAAPQWNGMQMAEPLLLVGDQGYGDTIQFARYIPLVAGRCPNLLLGCSPDLAGLLGRIPGITGLYTRWDAIPPHAAHCLLSSLPLMFGTELGTIPGGAPYLTADPARVRSWAERLGARGQKRVGVAWSGRPSHPNDRRRSLKLPALAPLGAVGGITWVSLQQQSPASDRASGALPGLMDISDHLTDFDETAAVIANLDLVVGVDTGVCHLAGALGRPVWTMLPNPADWRWLSERNDSPWYPSMRLFRQPAPGAWDAVLADMAAALRAFVAG